jgi:hypothetical protein
MAACPVQVNRGFVVEVQMIKGVPSSSIRFDNSARSGFAEMMIQESAWTLSLAGLGHQQLTGSRGKPGEID